ncbi:replication-relaxation family protein [Candidatus Acetothermia bacterium]|nr:replication-relaxation family protein [Candidatus Acetothermia bacterium]
MLPLKFFTRPEIKPGLVLTERDRALVRWCYELRTADSVMLALLVDSSHDRAARRLHLLWAHEYLDRPHGQFFLKVKEEMRHAVYSLGREGARLIAEEDHLPFASLRWQYAKNHEAKDRYLKHTLEIAKFRAALTLALREENSTLILKRWISGMHLAKESVKGQRETDSGLPGWIF